VSFSTFFKYKHFTKSVNLTSFPVVCVINVFVSEVFLVQIVNIDVDSVSI